MHILRAYQVLLFFGIPNEILHYYSPNTTCTSDVMLLLVPPNPFTIGSCPSCPITQRLASHMTRGRLQAINSPEASSPPLLIHCKRRQHQHAAMAISNDIGGVEVEIFSPGLPHREYTTSDCGNDSPRVITKYIKARSGTPFKVKVRF